MAKDHKAADTDGDADFENIWLRAVHMVIIAFLMSIASSLLGLLTIAQFVIMLFNKREPNEQLAEIGTTMGVWMAKAARYQTAASEVKPWPWTELD
ncbi:DUF4389 domain-containing protein [Yoonia sp. R2-816]|uniref:DUF4389 domain-containing protein n=1 Tax=Yoonia sp. R2-816 TaxID=3342638 RepID=UPI00372B908D